MSMLASESVCLLPINSVPLHSTPTYDTYSESALPGSAVVHNSSTVEKLLFD